MPHICPYSKYLAGIKRESLERDWLGEMQNNGVRVEDPCADVGECLWAQPGALDGAGVHQSGGLCHRWLPSQRNAFFSFPEEAKLPFRNQSYLTVSRT